MLSVEEWTKAFPLLPETCAATQQSLARLALPQPTARVREISEMDAAAAGGPRSLPRP